MKALFIIAPMTLISMGAHAQWLCREASSTRSGQTITACGVGRSHSLEEARVKSRESAVEEFKRVCQLSADCSDYDYTVVPKRTDCEFKDGNQVCYRALDFEISDRKRKSVSLDLSDLEVELKQKNQEIQAIQDRIEKISQIKQSELEAASKKQELATLEASLNQKEAEALKLQDLNSKDTVESGGYRYLHQAFQNSIKVSFHYWASQLTSDSESDIMWIAAYEKRPWSWLGVQIYGGFGNGRLENQKRSDADVPPQGSRNSTQNFNGTVAYVDVGVAALVYSGWHGTYLKFDLGRVGGRKESYVVNYNNSGVGSPQKSESNFSANYYGAELGFDTRDDRRGWGVFFELGARRVVNHANPGFIGGLGVNYGF